MKRINVFNIILQLIVILGSIVIGITVLTYIYQHEYYNKILIGLIIMSVGLMGLTEFFTLRFAIRMYRFVYTILGYFAGFLGIALGLFGGYSILSSTRLILSVGVSFAVITLIIYNFILHPWYMKNKNR